MDYHKWDTYYNRVYMPFHGESAGTSHYRFSEAPREPFFEHDFAGSDGISTSAAYCTSTGSAHDIEQPENEVYSGLSINGHSQ